MLKFASVCICTEPAYSNLFATLSNCLWMHVCVQMCVGVCGFPHTYMQIVLVNCRSWSFSCTSLVAIRLDVVILYAQLNPSVSVSACMCVRLFDCLFVCSFRRKAISNCMTLWQVYNFSSSSSFVLQHFKSSQTFTHKHTRTHSHSHMYTTTTWAWTKSACKVNICAYVNV